MLVWVVYSVSKYSLITKKHSSNKFNAIITQTILLSARRLNFVNILVLLSDVRPCGMLCMCTVQEIWLARRSFCTRRLYCHRRLESQLLRFDNGYGLFMMYSESARLL